MNLTNDIPRSLIRSKKNSKRRRKLLISSFAFLLVFGLLNLCIATQAQDTNRLDAATRAESSTPPVTNDSSNHSRRGVGVLKKIIWLPSKIKKGLAKVLSYDREKAAEEAGKDSRVLSLCELVDNWKAYHQQKVRVRGIYQVGAEQAWFYDPACKNGGATLTGVSFREHVHGAAKELDKIVAGNKSARVTFEGVFYGSGLAAEKSYLQVGSFHNMIKVKTVANPVAATGQPAEAMSKAEANQPQDLREEVRSTIALPFPSRADEARAKLKGLGTSAIPFIAEAIRFDSRVNPIKKAFLIDVIADIEGEDADGALITFLSDPTPHVRGFAAIELGSRKATSAIPHLIALLNDEGVYEVIVSSHPASERPVLVRDVAIQSLETITGMVLSPGHSKIEQAEDWLRWWHAQKS